jgi:hypothetical protein
MVDAYGIRSFRSLTAMTMQLSFRRVRDYPLCIEDAPMALTELTALDNAYQALQPLGQAARCRALQWLTDALVNGHTRPDTPAAPDTTAPEMTASKTTGPAVEPVTADAPPRRRKAAVAAPKHAPASARAASRSVPSADWPTGSRCHDTPSTIGRGGYAAKATTSAVPTNACTKGRSWHCHAFSCGRSEPLAGVRYEHAGPPAGSPATH